MPIEPMMPAMSNLLFPIAITSLPFTMQPIVAHVVVIERRQRRSFAALRAEGSGFAGVGSHTSGAFRVILVAGALGLELAENSIADWEWLASEEGEGAIAEARASTKPLHLELVELRKRFGAARAHLVVAQGELRKKAARKFGDWADRLIWNEKLLEQATDRDIAEYKAKRFPAGGKLLDLCCGAGGDLFALAERGAATGYDRSPAAALLAEVNAKRLGREAKVVCGDAQDAPLEEAEAWHIDPDRRSGSERTSQLAFASPDAATLRRMLESNPHAAIKTAPADRKCELASEGMELEWIGSRGECRQLVLWSGKLARHPGKRTATVVEHPDFTVVGEAHAPIEYAERIGTFLHEPHNAMLGAELENALAASIGATRVDPMAAYFTSETSSLHPALESYRVLESMPFDRKGLKQWVRERKIGVLEIKKRGAAIDPAALRKQLAPKGDGAATLILTPHRGKVWALVVERA